MDDEPLSLNKLESILMKIPSIKVLQKYTNPFLMIEEIGQLEVDVVFLEMKMGMIHGLHLSEEVKGMYPHVDIVFVTTYPQFALQAFEVNATDYLMKPVSLIRLQQTFRKIKKNQHRHNRAEVFVYD